MIPYCIQYNQLVPQIVESCFAGGLPLPSAAEFTENVTYSIFTNQKTVLVHKT